ncbi:MAG: RNA-directed DNA polymerase [Pleurocapsa sp. MO_192.B19]|nr:RNA-directed DNA polymerase [Pleurocapsa sp. MO_192.B19]
MVLQTIVETLSPLIKDAQPSERAYYSRSHKQPKKESDIDETFPYPWWELWPAFQKRIYEFTSTFDYVVVTDIANYFDNVSLAGLRNVISSYGHFEECLLDFLFFILEAFVWRPDYLPLSGYGLPQVDFDAPRLLAFAFLFEIDKFLERETSGNFVRWMDDIDFGVNDIEQAKKILRGLDEILLTRGLRLNMGKTKILSSSDARKYFLPDENRYLTIITNRIDRLIASKNNIKEEKRKIRLRFKKFLKKDRVGRWEKIYARYFTISCKTKDIYLEKYVPDLLDNHPGLRNNIYRYYTNLGYNKKRFNHLIAFFKGYHCSDDSSIFATAKVFVDWQIKAGSARRQDLVNLAFETVAKSLPNFIASLWLLAKYGSGEELFTLVENNINKWHHSNFLSRQVAAIVPKVRKDKIDFLKRTFTEHGQVDSLRVIENLDELRNNQSLSKDVLLYLKHGSDPIKVYPLAKFLIVIDILNNQTLDSSIRQQLRNEVVTRINDPVYIKEINCIKI